MSVKFGMPMTYGAAIKIADACATNANANAKGGRR